MPGQINNVYLYIYIHISNKACSRRSSSSLCFILITNFCYSSLNQRMWNGCGMARPTVFVILMEYPDLSQERLGSEKSAK